jgi:hypothetical protein
MLDLPGIVEAEIVGQFHLLKRLMKEIALVALVPGPRQLQLVEHSKAHFRPRDQSFVVSGTQRSVPLRSLSRTASRTAAPRPSNS